jgi:oxidase EvaA
MSTTRQIENDFFKSALAKGATVSSVPLILEWIKSKSSAMKTRIEPIPLERMRSWRFDEASGDIVHESGRFFSIEGIRVETDWGLVSRWEQPIINQPEIGYLGIIAKKIDGILHFLMQAKIEPGNINRVQLAPTIQATKSNCTRVHQGKVPLFLEYFNGERPVTIRVNQLQSEQGARFLRKRNCNMIVEVPEKEPLPVPDDFIWATLGQLKELIRHDNVVNMDTRTVLSGIPFGSYVGHAGESGPAAEHAGDHDRHFLRSLLDPENHLHDLDRIISWITGLKMRYHLRVTRLPLREIKGWEYNGGSIRHQDGKYFSVIGVDVEIGNREVQQWTQPMIQPMQEGIMAFIVKPIGGVYHFLVQAKLEAGNFDVLELAPTVQCLTGNYRTGKNEYAVPFIDAVLGAKKERIGYSALQSEEGGRFYQEQNRNMIIEAEPGFPIAVPDNYCWMTLNQLSTFIKFNNYLNIAARSLIAAVSF